MMISKKPGFTIIETVLFLGVTGLLIVGILAGTGSSISAQRYKDSVASLQSMLQQQYTNVLSVSNDRSVDWRCNADGTVTKIVGVGDLRGQTECVYLGKFITATPVSGTTKELVIKNVIGRRNGTMSTAVDDISVLRQYNMTAPSGFDAIKYNINWNSSIQSTSGVASSFSLLILQSPASGIAKTFINPSSVVADNNIVSLVSSANLLNNLQICVNNNGLSSGNKLGVMINAGSANAGGVERIGDSSACR